MKYHFKVKKEKLGFSAQCIELPGCITEGDTSQELYVNMQEALNLYIEEPDNASDLAKLPDQSIKESKTVIAVPVDHLIAFAFMVRYYRIKNRFTQKEVAKKMGFETLYSYQRLETKKCNPSLKIISKIKQMYPDFSVDFALN